MHISWKWLSEMVDLSSVGGPQGLADLLTARGLEVEEVRSLAKGFDKVITAQILERNRHPQADRLSLCKVSVGQGEPLDIVCGAQNMKAGDRVVLAQIGAHLPNGLKIAQGKIRGEVSNGMLCSKEELGLAESSEGIIILPEDTKLGVPYADLLGRNDTILTLKLTANRGDCMSHYGLAREVAAALGQKPRMPERAELPNGGSPVSVHLEAGDAAPQFWGCYMDGVKIGPSPEWVVRRLEALGSRSINNVVDATNLVLFELGHPVHAYDADFIRGNRLSVQVAKAGDELPLLDGGMANLDGSELVIADGERAVGLAGVMGGGNSEVSDQTTRVFLECAEFNPVLVRRAAFRHQRRTEAAQRFEKGVDPAGLPAVLGRLAYLIQQLAGGTVRGTSVANQRKSETLHRQIRLKKNYISTFLGMPALQDSEVEKVLRDHDCAVESHGDEWVVTAPTYRMDLAIREDLAEEVARSIGYDKIPATIPETTSQPTTLSANPAQARLVVTDRAKDALAQVGVLETLNLGFTSAAWLKQFGMFEEGQTVRVCNPLSEEFEYMVPSLLPGVVRNVIDNWRHTFGSEALPIRLFELRPTFHANGAVESKGELETNIQERWKLAIALSGPRFANGLRNQQGEVDFYDLKGVIEYLFDQLGTKGVRMQPVANSRLKNHPVINMLHPGQSAEILVGNNVAGHFGLLHPAKAKEFKTRAPLWIAELDWDVLYPMCRSAVQSRLFKSWPDFPSMERDFALVVKNDVPADKITQLALKAGKPLAKVAKVFDIYQGHPIPEGMTSVAVRVIFYEEGRSLQESETEATSTRILEAWKKELGAELRS